MSIADVDVLAAAGSRNALGQMVGLPVTDWQPAAWPPRRSLSGRFCRLEPLDAASHGPALFAAMAADERNWTYLSYGPFAVYQDYQDWLAAQQAKPDPHFYAIVDGATDLAVGVAAYLRIDPAMGCIELGHLNFSPALQRRPAATEAMYLLMRQAFELGYRRYEWKCDTLNLPSRQAAERLGFRFEGLFRQAMVYKGRNRDTAWFSILDSEWPALRQGMERWLAPDNFDAAGRQLRTLAQCRGGD
ncbi:GNAT family N-acetyltransferase [Chromobacterium aquaticum]|uniref:GNAT family N-acetyltransferase n=1 Tax=Chromobacterium aquaticum TaxID=467180 RepID=A0ABV8ZUI9_9NEIS|nr:GNAT family protein [Chromobacterium aquaticum]MCD5363502.1 GNAT family N-acetyltransferase [Chromobacterium aquaticum]